MLFRLACSMVMHSPGTVSDKPRHRGICSVPSPDQGRFGDPSKHRGVRGVTSPERGSVGRDVWSVHSPSTQVVAIPPNTAASGACLRCASSGASQQITAGSRPSRHLLTA